MSAGASVAGVPDGGSSTAGELDLVVVGSGVAGLSAAVQAASSGGLRVGIVTKGELHQATTRWAQGGIAAVLGGDPDSIDLHLADTIQAGAGLCDVDAVRVLVQDGPRRVQELIALGAVFDTDPTGALVTAREGGHSVARVIHAGGAATGVEVERALVDAVHETAALVAEHTFATDLVVDGGRCAGVRTVSEDGSPGVVRARHVLLASGGAGQLFSITTNPLEATGDGIAMALRAGVAVADVEFIQFHPTALHHPRMPRPLLSEALRGHGALLRDAHGERFVDELAPRDVVARAMSARMAADGVDHLWLDATTIADFADRFPTLAAEVASIGLDPAKDWLPVAPAAHYLCGGVVTDLDGATTLPGLWACGEVACTGVHGANRLASNSLLEGMVFGPRIIDAVLARRDGPRSTGAMRTVAAARGEEPVGESLIGGRLLAFPPAPAEAGSDAVVDRVDARRRSLQSTMTADVGVVRDAAHLDGAVRALAALRATVSPGDHGPAAWELRNLTDVARAVATAALARTESRGGHLRADHPDTDPRATVRFVFA